MSEGKPTIPKFASFKSEPSSTAQRHIADKEENRETPRDGRQLRKGHHHHHRRHQSSSRGREHDRTVVDQRAPPADRESSHNLFVVDRRGDVKNLTYGSIHRYDVPPFHRFGAGRVLGALPEAKIDREYGDDKGLVLSDSRHSRRGIREKYIFSKVEKQRPRLLRLRHGSVSDDHSSPRLDYIPISNNRARKRKRAEHCGEDGSTSESDTHYRSIHGKLKAPADPEDYDLQYATESGSSGSDAGRVLKVDADLRAANVKLQRHVDHSPHDVSAWLALIEHQDMLVRNGDEKRRVTNAEIKSTAEIKIHMHEKALENVKSMNDREILLLGLMSEGSKIWEVKVQADRWEQISKENIESLVLWKSYVNFKQSTFAKFRYEEVRDVYIKEIKLLSEAAPKSDNPSLYRQLLYVLLRFTLFVRESGYSELAIAIWQGLLELNLRAPTITTSNSENIELFQGFWESEVARIGEGGSVGWRHFTEAGDASDIQAILTDENDSHLNSQTIFKSWATAERQWRKASRMPARTLDEVKEDDPFRVILFSDIEEFLVLLPTESHEFRYMLLNTFLLFCGLPPVVGLDREDLPDLQRDDYVKDRFLHWHYSAIKKEFLDAQPNYEENVPPISDIFKRPFLDFPISSESLFGGNQWFQGLRPWRNLYPNDDGPVTYTFVRNCLQQLTSEYFQEDLAELYLAFESYNATETIKKTAKSLLKQHPASLRCYNAYASIEWARGNREVATGVFAAALSLSSATQANESNEAILLWKSWVWTCLDDFDSSKALELLLSVPDGTPALDIQLTPTILLKSKQHLTAKRDHLLTTNNSRLAIIHAELLALLTYLTSTSTTEPQSSTQGDITSALSTITAFSQTLTSRNLRHSTTHELLFLSASRLLQHHIRRGPYRPTLLRTHLTTFLTLFPRNTAFLSLYSHNESRLRISNRVRTILLTTILTPSNDNLSSRLFAIHHEIRHGTIHSVRSAFEHAVASPATRGSAGLWRFYMIWCWERVEFRKGMKEVWLRAIRACPWAVELYAFGLERLDGIVPFDELKRTWRVLGEKELRVHVDLEDLFEEMDERDARDKEVPQVGREEATLVKRLNFTG